MALARVQKKTDVPVTQKLLYGVRDELLSKMKSEVGGLRAEMKSEIGGLRAEMKAETSGLRSEIATLRTETKAETSGLRNEIATLRTETKAETSELRNEIGNLRTEMTAGFGKVQAQLDAVQSEVFRIGVLVEEQNARNAIVLDGLSGLFHRQERIEKRTDAMESVLAKLVKTSQSRRSSTRS